jgi:hypothetical protein
MSSPRSPGPGSRPAWLPRPARRRPLPPDPWCPPPLTRAEVEDPALRHVLVEEMVGDSVGLLVAAWPRARDGGRPVFGDPERDVEVGAGRRELQAHVDRLRRPPPGAAPAVQDELRRRPLALGDVFAVRVDPGALEEAASVAVADPGWLAGPVVDVTAEARVAARQVFYEALTPPLPERAREEIEDELRGRG